MAKKTTLALYRMAKMTTIAIICSQCKSYICSQCKSYISMMIDVNIDNDIDNGNDDESDSTGGAVSSLTRRYFVVPIKFRNKVRGFSCPE